jgi:hypothetical protein
MINKNSLKAILNQNGIKEWQYFQQDNINKLWLPLIKLEEYNGYVGLSSEGEWVFVKKRGMKVLEQRDNFFVVHPLLKNKRTELMKQFIAALTDFGLPAIILKTFPFDNLIVSAIDDNPQWIERAIEWLNEGYPPNDMIAEAFSKRGLNPSVVRRWQDDRLEKITQIG